MESGAREVDKATLCSLEKNEAGFMECRKPDSLFLPFQGRTPNMLVKKKLLLNAWLSYS